MKWAKLARNIFFAQQSVQFPLLPFSLSFEKIFTQNSSKDTLQNILGSLETSLKSNSPYSVRMRENEDQKNSEYSHFLRSSIFSKSVIAYSPNFILWYRLIGSSKLTFTFSNSTTGTLKKDVKYAQSWQWKHQNDVIDVLLMFLLLPLNIFQTFL